jgi:hypothetical protein
MTAEEFGGREYNGLLVQPLTDDGELYVAHGHVGMTQFIRAIQECDLADCGDGLPDLTVDDIDHRWATRVSGDGVEYEWRIDWCQSNTPGAFPVTTWQA